MLPPPNVTTISPTGCWAEGYPLLEMGLNYGVTHHAAYFDDGKVTHTLIHPTLSLKLSVINNNNNTNSVTESVNVSVTVSVTKSTSESVARIDATTSPTSVSPSQPKRAQNSFTNHVTPNNSVNVRVERAPHQPRKVLLPTPNMPPSYARKLLPQLPRTKTGNKLNKRRRKNYKKLISSGHSSWTALNLPHGSSPSHIRRERP